MSYFYKLSRSEGELVERNPSVIVRISKIEINKLSAFVSKKKQKTNKQTRNF